MGDVFTDQRGRDIDVVNKTARDARLGAEHVGRVIRGIGDGIADVGRRIAG
jgi:hypothetical protein